VEAERVDEHSYTLESIRLAARNLVDRGALTGLDVLGWTRTSRAWSKESGHAPAGGRTSDRAILVLGILIGTLPAGGAVLGLYFMTHRLRRATSPVLILAMLVGAVAILLPALYRIGEGVFGEETDAAGGLTLLTAAGAALFLAGAFGVKAENWGRVYLGALVTGGALAFLAYAYVRWSVAP
jgi:hypothetical protein